MANTYTQIHIQTVFAVKHRQSLIHPSWENDLYKYITGIIQNYGHKLLAINGMPDHIHIFFGMRPAQSLSELMKYVKQDSTKWIHENKLVQGKFAWQEGFGAFSYKRADTSTVIEYIHNQKIHHHKSTFQDEYISMLDEFGVEFEQRYIFQPLE